MTTEDTKALIEQLRGVEVLALGLHIAASDRGQQRPMTLTELGEVVVTCGTAAVALEALSSSAPVNSPLGWQPIESAPKDGSEIVLRVPVMRPQSAAIGRWFDFGQVIHGVTGYWTAHATQVEPTHWMPLPPAPDAKDAIPPGPEASPASSDGVTLIAMERERQVSVEGWTSRHDDQHDTHELSRAAVCYIWAGRQASLSPDEQMPMWEVVRLPRDLGSSEWRVPGWPWAASLWKASADPIRNLVKAGALIAAEIDRLQRVNVSEADASPKEPREPIHDAEVCPGPACPGCAWRAERDSGKTPAEKESA